MVSDLDRVSLRRRIDPAVGSASYVYFGFMTSAGVVSVRNRFSEDWRSMLVKDCRFGEQAG